MSTIVSSSEDFRRAVPGHLIRMLRSKIAAITPPS